MERGSLLYSYYTGCNSYHDTALGIGTISTVLQRLLISFISVITWTVGLLISSRKGPRYLATLHPVWSGDI